LPDSQAQDKKAAAERDDDLRVGRSGPTNVSLTVFGGAEVQPVAPTGAAFKSESKRAADLVASFSPDSTALWLGKAQGFASFKGNVHVTAGRWYFEVLIGAGSAAPGAKVRVGWATERFFPAVNRCVV
jgi:hypothetical protein